MLTGYLKVSFRRQHVVMPAIIILYTISGRLSRLRILAFLDKISSVHEQTVRCASGHLVSSVHLTFLFTK